jgi:hypothetical protein
VADKYIGTYLNDHLAGSEVALELLKHVEAAQDGTDLGRFCAALRGEITADRRELEGLMARLDLPESRARKASAWLTEKLTGWKLRVDDPAGGPLRLLEAIEAVSLGIEGKRSLWRALKAAAAGAPALRILDYDRLIERAEGQRGRVEEVRLEIAQQALVPGT